MTLNGAQATTPGEGNVPQDPKGGEGATPQDPNAGTNPQDPGQGEGADPQDPKPGEGEPKEPKVDHKLEADNRRLQKTVEELQAKLKATDKTPYEQLYYYDLTAKKRITSVVDQKTKFGVKIGVAQQEKVKKAVKQGHIVVSLHNHPKGSPPSAADIRSGIANGQTSGLICGHDGSLYQYIVVHKPIAGYDLSDESWKAALVEIATNPATATESIVMKWGVVVDRLL